MLAAQGTRTPPQSTQIPERTLDKARPPKGHKREKERHKKVNGSSRRFFSLAVLASPESAQVEKIFFRAFRCEKQPNKEGTMRKSKEKYDINSELKPS